MAVRFVIGTGTARTTFDRAPLHTAAWDRQKQGFRQYVGLPAHGQASEAKA